MPGRWEKAVPGTEGDRCRDSEVAGKKDPKKSWDRNAGLLASKAVLSRVRAGDHGEQEWGWGRPLLYQPLSGVALFF